MKRTLGRIDELFIVTMNRFGGRSHQRGGPQSNVLTLVIDRDGLDAPWGFRLKGGRDVDGGTPLEITRVSETPKLPLTATLDFTGRTLANFSANPVKCEKVVRGICKSSKVAQ